MNAAETLEQWQADDDAAARARIRGRGVATREQLAGLTGLEQMQRMIAVEFPAPLGKQVATAEGRLVGHDGKLYAHASTTCLVFEVSPAK